MAGSEGFRNVSALGVNARTRGGRGAAWLTLRLGITGITVR
jgi:hypothetical protein